MGTPVVDAQKELQKTDAYLGAIDGWFFDKMKDAVKLFQEYAENGEFLINGVMTDIGEKLTGHQKGALDPKTQEMMKKVVEKGGKVPVPKGIKKGDKGKVVEEINIRLSGFGGGVPADTFDAVTEMKVKNFQRDYMKMKVPTGVVDEKTAKAIDEFGEKFAVDFASLKCPCGNCQGFGKGRKKGEYKNDVKKEKFHFYEYPGIHRSLLFALRGAMFHYGEKTVPELQLRVSSGYRCYTQMENKNRYTCNHLGKAVDIHIYEMNNGEWKRSADKREQYSDALRKDLNKYSGANINWTTTDAFSLEPSSISKTWVHFDAREFSAPYLKDVFFCKDQKTLDGVSMKTLLKEQK